MEQENRQKRRRLLPIGPKRERAAEDGLPEAPAKRPGRGRLRRRWLFNTLAVTLVVVAVAVSAFSLAMYSYYTSTILATLESKAQTAAGMFRNYTETTYLSTARQFISQFEEKTTIEVQILNANGRVLMSSMMDISGASAHSPDVAAAIGEKRVRTHIGQDPDTEDEVISASAPVIYNNAVVGVVRMATSLRRLHAQMVRMLLVTSAIGLVILLVMGLIASYFIRSVLDPVIRVTETAKRIAAGSYGVQMEKKTDDEMGELVDSINDMSMKIDQAERTQSEFISSVSHELRTPLTAIRGWGETLLDSGEPDRDTFRKGMRVIMEETERLSSMVEELLDFSRMQSGRLVMEKERLDAVAELSDAVLIFTERARQENKALEYQEPEFFAPVLGDHNRLRQVFINILDNALKYSDSGDAITVLPRLAEGAFLVTVSDTGCGISEEDLPMVKTRFYKGHTTRRGSGIGLAVADEIIRMHGGTLTLDSVKDKGTTVSITLPLEAPQG